jgi:hypothetical protein
MNVIGVVLRKHEHTRSFSRKLVVQTDNVVVLSSRGKDIKSDFCPM